jgi:ligand-binding SRPBCC domain-containing protein
MALVELQMFIAAPPERCFDLSRSVDLHVDSALSTGERAVAGRTSGLLSLGDMVTWEARHFGLRQRLSVRITEYDRPRWFRDEMISGPFRWMRHDHWFDRDGPGAKMRDAFEFKSRVALVDSLVIAPHIRRFLIARNEVLRRIAEGDDWRRYLSDPAPTLRTQ